MEDYILLLCRSAGLFDLNGIMAAHLHRNFTRILKFFPASRMREREGWTESGGGGGRGGGSCEISAEGKEREVGGRERERGVQADRLADRQTNGYF